MYRDFGLLVYGGTGETPVNNQAKVPVCMHYSPITYHTYIPCFYVKANSHKYNLYLVFVLRAASILW